MLYGGGVNCKSVLNYAQAAEITSMRCLVLSFKVEEIATFEKTGAVIATLSLRLFPLIN